MAISQDPKSSAGALEGGVSKVSGEPTQDAAETEEPKTEKKWVRYPINQETDELVIKKTTVDGILSVEGLKFVLIPEKFEAGSYEIVISDKTIGIA